jgi:hypothetical protein
MGTRVLATFTVAFLFAESASPSEPALPLTLRVYDSAGVPGKSLGEAKIQVRRIFTKAGVVPLWLDCAVAEPPDPMCVQKLQPAELAVRIVPGTSGSGAGHPLGAAFVTPEGFSHYATIFYGEVRLRGKREKDFEGRMLGYAIAHEAGHLLLGLRLHAPAGIMTSDLAAHKRRSRPKQYFLFTASEAGQIRTNLKARILAAEDPHAPASLIE